MIVLQKIVGSKIMLTRGDTLKAVVNMVKPDGDYYEPQEGDSIRFAMKKSFSDESVLLEKDIPNDSRMLWLKPEDTKEFPFGSYVYDIQITYANGDIDTFIDKGAIELTEEVC